MFKLSQSVLSRVVLFVVLLCGNVSVAEARYGHAHSGGIDLLAPLNEKTTIIINVALLFLGFCVLYGLITGEVSYRHSNKPPYRRQSNPIAYWWGMSIPIFMFIIFLSKRLGYF